MVSKVYKKNGIVHNENGPAIIFESGDKYWIVDGKFHNENGPAKLINNIKYYFINGKELTETEFKNRNRLKQLKKLLK